jgi:hypothetical protein
VRLRAGVRFLATVCSARKIPRPATSTVTDGWVGREVSLIIFFLLFLKSVLCFLESIFTDGSQLPACKNDDFYWPLTLAVTKNATVNRFTTATIQLICALPGAIAIRDQLAAENPLTWMALPGAIAIRDQLAAENPLVHHSCAADALEPLPAVFSFSVNQRNEEKESIYIILAVFSDATGDRIWCCLILHRAHL